VSATAKRTGVIVGSAEGFPAGPGYAPFGSHRVEVLEQYLPPGYLVRELNSGTLLFEGDDPESGPRLEACLIPLAQAGLTVQELEHLVDDLPCAGCHGRVTTYLPTHYGKMAPPVWCEECTRWKRNHGA
jgi:hypothetical protein